MEATVAPTVGAEQSARERLAQNLRQMVDEADQLLQSAQSTGTVQFNAARDNFETHLSRAKAELRRLEASTIDHTKRAARATDQAVHDHPYMAMGIAAGAGLLIGMLIARR